MAKPAKAEDNIKVCVRVRPFNEPEKARDDTLCVKMPTKTQVIITGDPRGGAGFKEKCYNFDRCFWSHSQETSPGAPGFATQDTLFDELGVAIEQNALQGFNNCLFAYGQTGAGKTYSVLGGEGSQAGLLPRLVKRFFEVREELKDAAEPTMFEYSVSFMEIYNDVIRDLLAPVNAPSAKKGGPAAPAAPKLLVRHKPKGGCFVQGLTDAPVYSKEDVQKLLDHGTKARSVGATAMNQESSRSHCIFTFELKSQTRKSDGSVVVVRSDTNLVDLAGSERSKKTEAVGARLKEGCAINQSLLLLAQVISKLAAGASFVPFRNCKLTEILEDSLSGNSKTVLIAALSPASSNAEETISTLEFAKNTKQIKTSAKAAKRQDEDADIVSTLREEILKLQALLEESKVSSKDTELARSAEKAQFEEYQNKSKAELEELENNLSSISEENVVEKARLIAEIDDGDLRRQRIMEEFGRSEGQRTALQSEIEGLIVLQEKYQRDAEEAKQLALEMHAKRSAALEDMGVTTEEMAENLGLNKSTPHLVNVSADPALMGCLTFFLTKGKDIAVGCGDADDIKLSGLGMIDGLCRLRNEDDDTVKVIAMHPEARVLVNGSKVKTGQTLAHGSRLLLGYAYCFCVVIPSREEEVATRAMDERSLELALAEVKPEETESFASCLQYVKELKDKVGTTRAEVFLKDFRKIAHMVDEANQISKEVRGKDRFEFCPEANVDIYKAQEDAHPECVVRLKRWESATTRMKNAVGRRRASQFEQQVIQQLGVDKSKQRFATVAVYPPEMFRERLHYLREAYAAYKTSGFVDFSKPENDPWREISPWELKEMIEAQNAVMAALQAERDQLWTEKEKYRAQTQEACCSIS
eukprot:TRINITY_DN1334_c0_g2_i1.p1 TRINITY_DN1334_c0_g2~~TRINITY_DN1334_c0_g2_i1.p1  ORF type:complete len:869 (+),score=276.89 TRINITY_DN1334_c0_g2_i1:148-2754(+)